MESKRDRLKQRDKPQQCKKATAELVEKPEVSGSSSVGLDVGRTGGIEERMDV